MEHRATSSSPSGIWELESRAVGSSRGLKPEARVRDRRRGSVLILVMVLLGVLFVMGVAFLASMDFESEMIAVRQERDVRETGINAVRQRVDSTLREGLMAGLTSPFGGSLDEPFLQTTDPKLHDPNASPIALGELPGVHNFAAPIDPYRLQPNINPSEPLVFGTFTDLVDFPSKTFNGSDKAVNARIFADWPSGVPLDPDPALPIPIDADGDGVTDTFAFTLPRFGFSQSRIDDLAVMVNPSSNPDGRVYMGLRIVSHGGMVNLNEAHQLLIANVLDLKSMNPAGQLIVDVGLLYSAGADKDLDGFRHSPTLRDSKTREQASYSPQSEEAQLRRRGGLLPPRVLSPSLVQGNALLDPRAALTGNADIPWLLPPLPGGKQNTFGSVFDSPAPQHRYTRFTMAHEEGDLKKPYLEPFDNSDPDGSASLWAVRMAPFEGFVSGLSVTPGALGFYDRRHLLTTVSHDDLLSRGGRVEEMDMRVLKPSDPPPPRRFDPPRSGDLRGRMIEVNEKQPDPDIACPGDPKNADGLPPYDDDVLPFEYADYPRTIPNEGCDCATDPDCRRDPRKGRLELSLPWLDEKLWCENPDPAITAKERAVCRIRRQRLIYDAFYMLVRNAKGPYWAEIDCASTPGICDSTGEVCLPIASAVPPRSVCHDPVTGQTHREALIARTAASLTANMIDYVDEDDIPTRVAIRSFDFRDVGVCDGSTTRMCATNGDCPPGVSCITVNTCGGGANHGRVCTSNSDCPDGVCIPGARTLGREINLATKADRAAGKFQFQYVYGLERQPYITEVATAVPNAADENVNALAIELFNPSDVVLGGNSDGDAWDDFWLVIGKGDAKPDVDAKGIKLTPARDIPPGQFGAYLSDTGNAFALSGGLGITTGRVYDLTGTDAANLAFENGDTVYLIRRYQYPTDVVPTDIVVDQFRVNGNNIAQPFNVLQGVFPPKTILPNLIFSMQRSFHDASTKWNASVPKSEELGPETLPHSLAALNDAVNADVHPVEVNFANTGRFNLDLRDDKGKLLAQGAFPTTGSMLLLMRHANRSLDEYTRTKDLAFTTWLDDKTTVATSSGLPEIEEFKQIDNGRMPVFDVGVMNGGKRLYAHHVSPASDPEVDPTKFDPNDTRNRPGRLMHLPWGQLVFDYFTALPLSSLGPYANPDKDKDFVVDLNAPPRIDMTGLRVHGRIDINAAPWKVLAGLPMIPAWRLPAAFRGKIGLFAGLDPDPLPPPGSTLPAPQPRPIGDQLAQGIVAYRDAREVVPPSVQSTLGFTGNYSDFDPTTKRGGRGWETPEPTFRRGTGFLTVGELANVRNLNSGGPAFRIDGADSADFVKAAAKLIALADWGTVRSHVFTVYGTLRGDFDSEIVGKNPAETLRLQAADVDRRAIRFQETLDRLPTFLGSPSPRSIGPPVVAKYIDTRDD